MLEEHFRHFSSASAMQLSFWLFFCRREEREKLFVFIAKHCSAASFYLLHVAFLYVSIARESSSPLLHLCLVSLRSIHPLG
jgi:hypothetical protein